METYISKNTYAKRRMGRMGEKRSTGDWGKAKLKKNTEFYMDMPTGKMGLRNPDAGADWELFQSTSTEKASYF